MQNKYPVVCGGFQTPTDCIVIGKDKVEPLVVLNQQRPASASVLVDENTLWITGAEWGQGQANSEFVVMDETGKATARMGKLNGSWSFDSAAHFHTIERRSFFASFEATERRSI